MDLLDEEMPFDPDYEFDAPMQFDFNAIQDNDEADEWFGKRRFHSLVGSAQSFALTSTNFVLLDELVCYGIRYQ